MFMTPKCERDVPMTCQEPSDVTSMKNFNAMMSESTSTNMFLRQWFMRSHVAVAQNTQEDAISGKMILSMSRAPILNLSNLLHDKGFIAALPAQTCSCKHPQ